MYKLMLVDDEAQVRLNVIKKIDWAQYGFEIVCEAENGREALELFELHNPDVVISDIKMPFMDGLELSEKILEINPFTKIIILTGFDEFEYAKKSVNLHISNYIVKPISAKELIKILIETKQIIDEEIKERRNVEKLKQHYDYSYALMRNNFLSNFVRGDMDFNQVEKWFDHYNIQLQAGLYMISIIKIDKIMNEETVDMNPEEQKIALFNIVEEVNQVRQMGLPFMKNNTLVIISSTNELDKNEFSNRVIRGLNEVKQAVEKYMTFHVTIGVGSMCNELFRIAKSYQDAKKAYEYHFIIGKGEVIFYNDIKSEVEESLVVDETWSEGLMRSLKSGGTAEYDGIIADIFVILSKADATGSEKQLFILQILSTITTISKTMAINVTEVCEEEVSRIINNLTQLDELKKLFTTLGYKLMDKISQSNLSKEYSLASNAKQFVKQNYKDWDLNIEQVANEFRYSPNYFSTVFKKETGQPFMNYLSDFRIEASKDLLINTKLKTLEIAMEVGFSSPNYYSYCFKKKEGISPSKYRKNYGDGS